MLTHFDLTCFAVCCSVSQRSLKTASTIECATPVESVKTAASEIHWVCTVASYVVRCVAVCCSVLQKVRTLTYRAFQCVAVRSKNCMPYVRTYVQVLRRQDSCLLSTWISAPFFQLPLSESLFLKKLMIGIPWMRWLRVLTTLGCSSLSWPLVVLRLLLRTYLRAEL